MRNLLILLALASTSAHADYLVKCRSTTKHEVGKRICNFDLTAHLHQRNTKGQQIRSRYSRGVLKHCQNTSKWTYEYSDSWRLSRDTNRQYRLQFSWDDGENIVAIRSKNAKHFFGNMSLYGAEIPNVKLKCLVEQI